MNSWCKIFLQSFLSFHLILNSVPTWVTPWSLELSSVQEAGIYWSHLQKTSMHFLRLQISLESDFSNAKLFQQCGRKWNTGPWTSAALKETPDHRLCVSGSTNGVKSISSHPISDVMMRWFTSHLTHKVTLYKLNSNGNLINSNWAKVFTKVLYKDIYNRIRSSNLYIMFISD